MPKAKQSNRLVPLSLEALKKAVLANDCAATVGAVENVNKINVKKNDNLDVSILSTPTLHDGRKFTLIQHAIYSMNPPLVKALLAINNPKWLCATSEHNSPLTFLACSAFNNVSAETDKAKEIAALLAEKYPSDLEKTDKNGWKPVHAALYYGNSFLLKDLTAPVKHSLTSKAWHLKNGKTLLHHAVESGTLTSIDTVLASGIPITVTDKDNRTIFHYCAFLGRNESIRHLLSKISPEEREKLLNAKDKFNQTPLDIAVSHGRTRAIEELKQYTSQANAEAEAEATPLLANHATPETVPYAIYGISGDDAKDTAAGNTALHKAMYSGNIAQMQRCVKEMSLAAINTENRAGCTALAIASILGRETTVEFFIAAIKEKYNEKNAQKIINYQMEGQFNKTAIHLSIEHNRRETGKLLISHSAEVNNTTAIGYTPLDRAFGVGAGWAIEDLVAKKAHRNLCKGNFRQPGASRRSEAVAAEVLSQLPPPDADASLPVSPWRAKMLLRTLGTSLPPLGAGVARYLPTPIPQAINGAGWVANTALTLNNEGRSKQPFGLKYCAEVSRKIPLLLLAAGASLGSTVAAMYYTYRINSASKEEQATMDAEKRNEAALNVMTALLVPVARAVHHSRYGDAVNAVVSWPVRALVKRWRRGAALTNGEVAGSIALTQVVIGRDEEKKEVEVSRSSSRESSVSREMGIVEVVEENKTINKDTPTQPLAPTPNIRRSEEKHTSNVIRSRSCPPDAGRY